MTDDTEDPLLTFTRFLEYAVPLLQVINDDCLTRQDWFFTTKHPEPRIAIGYAVTASMAKSAHSLMAPMLAHIRKASKGTHERHLNIVPPPHDKTH